MTNVLCTNLPILVPTFKNLPLMKKLSMLLSFALVLGLSMTSCSSDDNGVSVSEEKLAGKWNFSTTKYSGGGVSTEEEDYFGNQSGCSADYLQFNADGTLTEGDYFSGCDLGTSTGSWSLDGSEVSVTMDGSTTVYKVSSISGTKLKVVETYTESGFTFKETTTFTKAAVN